MLVNEPSVSYGMTDDRNILSIIAMIRKGVQYHHFNQVVKRSAFSIAEWSSFLHISERTMQRYEAENKTFDTIQSEKIVQITMLNNYGEEVFKSREAYQHWLETKNIALGGILPKSLLDSNFGIEMVKDALSRIAYGVLA